MIVAALAMATLAAEPAPAGAPAFSVEWNSVDAGGGRSVGGTVGGSPYFRLRGVVGQSDAGPELGGVGDSGDLYAVRGGFLVSGILAPPCFGDANGDGQVNFIDLNIVLGDFGQVGPELFGDVNADGTVNFVDLNIVLGAFGSGC